MAEIKLKNSKIIGDFLKPYIVAEINTSHFGSIDTAKELILQAKIIGCDCVKFQSWSANSLYSSSYYKDNPIAKRFVDKFSFSNNTLSELAEFSKKNGIDFASTPYSLEEVNFLLDYCHVPYIKIASMDLNNYSYLEYIASTGIPMILSTGMAEIDEIRQAVKTIEKVGNKNLCLLHCISIYPPAISTIRLKNIEGLRKEFPRYPIGFSDHSIGISIPIAAVALGACLLEKHFTLNKNKIGMDNQMATEPEEMQKLIISCHNVQTALGGTERIIYDEEKEQRLKIRRSVVSTSYLRAGTKIEIQHICLKRPGTGIPPENVNSIIGKTLLKNIEEDNLILLSDLSN